MLTLVVFLLLLPGTMQAPYPCSDYYNHPASFGPVGVSSKFRQSPHNVNTLRVWCRTSNQDVIAFPYSSILSSIEVISIKSVQLTC